MLNVTNLSTLNIAGCLYTDRHCLSFIRLRPSHNFPFLNNQTCCLDTLVTKAHFYHFFLHQTQSKRDGNVREKAWQTLFTRDRPIWFFQGRYRYQLLVVKEADNGYLEPIFICSKRENNGVNILSNTNYKT